LAEDGQIESLGEIDKDRSLARREEVPFAAEPVGPQFGPEELFDLLGALGFARCRWKSRVARGGGAGIDRHPRQNWANRRLMLLSHHVASGNMRLMRPHQVEGELKPAFPV